jgi:hypothetical protein
MASCMACVAPTPPDGLNCKLRGIKRNERTNVSGHFFLSNLSFERELGPTL